MRKREAVTAIVLLMNVTSDVRPTQSRSCVRSARGGVLAVFTRQNKPVLYLKIRATLKMRVSAAQAVGKDVKRGDFVGSSR
jgi:hypothetical protein